MRTLIFYVALMATVGCRGKTQSPYEDVGDLPVVALPEIRVDAKSFVATNDGRKVQIEQGRRYRVEVALKSDQSRDMPGVLLLYWYRGKNSASRGRKFHSVTCKVNRDGRGGGVATWDSAAISEAGWYEVEIAHVGKDVKRTAVYSIEVTKGH